MSYKELEEMSFKVWLSTNDIRKLANNCGRETALRIRNAVEKQIIDSGHRLFESKTKVVPTKWVFELLGLDEAYITEMAKREREAEGLENNYGNIPKR